MTPLTHHDIYNILQTKRPVSIIRAGDGENLVLHSTDNLQAYRQCIASVMIRQMGYEPTMSEVEQIRQNLISAYNNADIIGIPMHKNLDDLGKQWTSVADTIKPLTSDTARFCSTDVCYDMLYVGLLSDWLRDAPVVNYIGCRDIDEGLRNTLGVKQVNSYIIAPEAKFTSGYEGPQHYPIQFNEMEWWMNAAPCNGNPCLVGAGVVGKIYCNWFRDRGGVAIDVGAVMDLWAGFSTRGPNRGLDVVNEKYKL